MYNKKKSFLSIILIVIFLGLFVSGCGNSTEKNKILELTKELQDSVEYEVEYIEDRNVIRLSNSLSKEVVMGAITIDSIYGQWVGIREGLLVLYDELEMLGESKDITEIEYEIIVLDKESVGTDTEIPVLIVNKTGVIFDAVDTVRNK